jgi:gamma-glutamyltranspeptidase/glutathione hydrolase
MSIDFRETAPAAAFKDMYKNHPEESIWSGLASGVPGDVRGLEYLHKKYGVSRKYIFPGPEAKMLKVLPWKAVVNPAAHVALYGFEGNYRDFQ